MEMEEAVIAREKAIVKKEKEVADEWERINAIKSTLTALLNG